MELKEINNIVKQFLPNEDVMAFSNTLGEESENIDEVKADFEIIQNIIDGLLSSCKNILTLSEKDNLLFSGNAITLL